MLPLVKVFTLCIRVFARPFINRTKDFHLKNKSKKPPKLRNFYIRLGNFYHNMETKINSQYLKLANTSFFVKPLNDDQAIEKGVEFFYEIIFYSIIIGIPCYEMYKAAVDNNKKTLKNEARIKKIEKDIRDLQEQKQKTEDNIQKVQELHDVIMDRLALIPKNVKQEQKQQSEKERQEIFNQIQFLHQELSVRLKIFEHRHSYSLEEEVEKTKK